MDTRPIGIFDSGVGGLTIRQAIARQLPSERLIYLADTAHFPYGGRDAADLEAISLAIVDALRALGCKLVVVACNTASVAALPALRCAYPGLPFVGVVPVVKLLAERTRSGVIPLLSTPSTAGSPYLADLAARFAPGLRFMSIGCPGLADAVEAGDTGSAATLAMLRRYLAPVLDAGADVLGLGCTHYPFLRSQIDALLGPAVAVYDSAEPVARRVAALLQERDALAPACVPAHRYLVTGDSGQFAAVAAILTAEPLASVEGIDLISVPQPRRGDDN